MHLPRYWIDRRLYEYVAVNMLLRVSNATPILVYQMGKVGSSSVRNSLFRSRDPATALVFMSHEYHPVRDRRVEELDVEAGFTDGVAHEIAQAQQIHARFPLRRRLGRRFRERFYVEQIYRRVLVRGRPAKIITLVRDPVASNLSMFFQVFGHIFGVPYAEGRFTTSELIDTFLRQYPHVRPVTWFDVEFRRTTGVDVYRHAFPREQGYTVISHGNVDVLILKCELSDTTKAEAIKEFVGLRDLTIVRSNTAQRKPYAGQYGDVRRQLVVPVPLLDALYQSKFARHFYTEPEIRGLRRQWEREVEPKPGRSDAQAPSGLDGDGTGAGAADSG